MKKLTRLLTLMVLIATVSSCSNILDKKIDLLTIDNDIKEIKTKNPDFDSTKTDILDNLLALSKGREFYINDRLKSEDKESSLEKYIVEEDKFKEITDNLFNYFKANNITYKSFLTEIDSLKSLDDKYDNKLKTVYEEIDKICNEKQKDMDEKDKKAIEIKEKLGKMVDLTLLSIRETEYDYRDVVEVKIKMTNKTDKRIEALGFNMELTDKLGNKVASLRCKSNDGFTTSDIGTWTYGRYDREEIYKGLQNVNASHVTAKPEITRINLGGELISAYDADIESLLNINYAYKTPKKLTGYCPYLGEEDALNIKIKDAQKEKQKEIKDRFTILNKYRDELNKLFDFSKIYDGIK